jgi:hypothetical protein
MDSLLILKTLHLEKVVSLASAKFYMEFGDENFALP